MNDQAPRDWLVLKRGLYYAPGDAGYTGIRGKAGRYTEAEAKRRAAVEPESITAVHIGDAPEFSLACWPEVRDQHLKGKALRREAEMWAAAREAQAALRLIVGKLQHPTASVTTLDQDKAEAALARLDAALAEPAA